MKPNKVALFDLINASRCFRFFSGAQVAVAKRRFPDKTPTDDSKARLSPNGSLVEALA